MTVIGSYSISHVSLQIDCEDEWLTERVIDIIDNYLCNATILQTHTFSSVK